MRHRRDAAAAFEGVVIATGPLRPGGQVANFKVRRTGSLLRRLDGPLIKMPRGVTEDRESEDQAQKRGNQR